MESNIFGGSLSIDQFNSGKYKKHFNQLNFLGDIVTMETQRLNYFFLLTAFYIVSIGTYTSISLSGLSHIAMGISILFFLMNGQFNPFDQFKHHPIHGRKSLVALWLLVITSIFSILFNLDITPHPLSNLAKLKYFVLPLLIVMGCQIKDIKISEKHLKRMLILLTLSATLASLSGIIGLMWGYNPLKFKDACHPSRACGLYGMYMTYGYGISFFMTLLTGLYIDGSRKKWSEQKWLLLALLINGLGLFLSYTRGGWIGYLISIPFFFLGRNKKLFFKVILSVMIVLGGLFLFPQVQKMFYERSESNVQRIAFYKAAYYAFKEKPFLGIGHKNFESQSKKLKKKYLLPFAKIQGHAHSNYLEQLANTGIIGLISFLLFLFFWLKELYVDKGLMGRILLPVVVNFIVSGLFQNTFGDGENLFFIMFMWPLSQLFPGFMGENSASNEDIL